jgi:hypothetical protein
LYHEKRIALVNNFVCLLPLKNSVQGRKGHLKVEKKIPWKSSFPLFYPWAGKVKSFFTREIIFSGYIKTASKDPKLVTFSVVFGLINRRGGTARPQ